MAKEELGGFGASCVGPARAMATWSCESWNWKRPTGLPPRRPTRRITCWQS